ncbi:hypothetical protein [Halobacillus karajensis]|uniref:Uncharacterized protein n=1 Tax=Halobacillus karajensis TaxID=195088 RepID=A0A024P109_9BACI|nr:hypothetical protein [Halobacillus karajensis]CDQ19372.1 hypothetical protein BN982_01665 [Halobacillus karajensis]CDQ21835.1 hypothetical protein BN983_00029 [Halobacillus karajensis]CDQ27675.1 hypothetical protein BN981_01955 [Halobacillus karajensis]
MNVNLLGNGTVQARELSAYIYKTLKAPLRWNRKLDEEIIDKGIVKKEKIYHPMWAVKMLVIADRKPFPPRKKPNMAFVDAVSGYRGLFPNVPFVTQEKVSTSNVKEALITKQELLEKYITDIQKKQINRNYVLKKPRYEIRETEMVYLPLWKVEVETTFFTETFVINGNTGESEDLLMKLWNSNEWKL